MSSPYREAAAASDLAVFAALPPDAYRPESRWAMGGRIGGSYVAALAAAVALGLVSPFKGLAIALCVLWYCAVIGHALYRRRVGLRCARANDEAIALLNAGAVSEAAAALDRLAVTARGIGFYHALAVFNRGVVFTRQGEPEKALRLFEAVAGSRWFPRFQSLGFDALLAVAEATTHALLGDLPAAERALAAAESQTRPAVRGRVLMAQCLVGLRRGDDAATAARIDAEWTAAEAALPANQLRVLRALQAWALVRAGADAAAVARAIERARPSSPGEYDHLGARWPELADFLRARIDPAR